MVPSRLQTHASPSTFIIAREDRLPPSACLTTQNLSLFHPTWPTRPPSSSGARSQVSSSGKYVLEVHSTFPEMARSFSWWHHTITRCVAHETGVELSGFSTLAVPRSTPSYVTSTPGNPQEDTVPHRCEEHEKKSRRILRWTDVEQYVSRNYTLQWSSCVSPQSRSYVRLTKPTPARVSYAFRIPIRVLFLGREPCFYPSFRPKPRLCYPRA